MARREVLEVTCDRCGKTQSQTKSEVTEKAELVITVAIKGETQVNKTYDDLCHRCRETVLNYGKKIALVADDPKKNGDQDTPSK